MLNCKLILIRRFDLIWSDLHPLPFEERSIILVTVRGAAQIVACFFYTPLTDSR